MKKFIIAFLLFQLVLAQNYEEKKSKKELLVEMLKAHRLNIHQKKEIKKLKNSEKAHSQRIIGFKTEIKNNKKAYSQHISDLKTENSDLKTENSDLKTENSDLKTENSKLDMVYENTQKKLRMYNKMMEQLSAANKELYNGIKKNRSRLAEKDSRLAEKDNQLAEKDNQLAEKDNQLSSIKTQLNKYKKLRHTNEEKDQRIAIKLVGGKFYGVNRYKGFEGNALLLQLINSSKHNSVYIEDAQSAALMLYAKYSDPNCEHLLSDAGPYIRGLYSKIKQMKRDKY